jgi:2-haloacid dehalogenase
VNTVVFDLGGVLVDWDPRYLLRKLMPGREAEVETLLADVLNHAWNLERDKGDSWHAAMEQLKLEYPQWADIFDLYTERWPETLRGSHEDTVAILRELKHRGTTLYALSNWSAEMFPHAEAKYDWLGLFDGVIVSGRVGMIKPDRDIFDLLLETYDLEAGDVFFIDDNVPNVLAARSYGIHAHQFEGADALRAELEAEGLLDPAGDRVAAG